jgi:CheY-like chemotaxis protein
MEKKNILIIDDDPDFTESTRLLLQSSGYAVDTARDGKEGLEKARETRPDFILLDIMMPGKEGYSTCRELKEDPVTCAIPVLMASSISSRGGRGYAARIAKYHRADDFIEKPFKREDLIGRIRKLLEKAREICEPKKARKILVVDDDPDFSFSIEQILAASGYEVFLAESGVEAIKMANAFTPDAILLDVMLPDRDGFSVCLELKKDPKTHAIPVVIITSVGKEFVEPEYAQEIAGEHWADGFMSKPVKPEQLLEKLEEVMTTKRARLL